MGDLPQYRCTPVYGRNMGCSQIWGTCPNMGVPQYTGAIWVVAQYGGFAPIWVYPSIKAQYGLLPNMGDLPQYGCTQYMGAIWVIAQYGGFTSIWVYPT